MCNLCDASNNAMLKGIAEALAANTLTDLQHLDLYDFDQLDNPDDVADSLSQLLQKLSGDQVRVEVFPKNRLTLAEGSKRELGRDTFHMHTFVFKPAGDKLPIYFGLGRHNEGVALFDHASDEVLEKRAARASLRAKLDGYYAIGSQRERALDESLRARLQQILESAEPTDGQKALLELALGKNWLNAVLGPGYISTRTVLGLMELLGHHENPVFAAQEAE